MYLLLAISKNIPTNSVIMDWNKPSSNTEAEASPSFLCIYLQVIFVIFCRLIVSKATWAVCNRYYTLEIWFMAFLDEDDQILLVENIHLSRHDSQTGNDHQTWLEGASSMFNTTKTNVQLTWILLALKSLCTVLIAESSLSFFAPKLSS